MRVENSDKVDCYRRKSPFLKTKSTQTLPTKVAFCLPLILLLINSIIMYSYFRCHSHIVTVLTCESQTVRVWSSLELDTLLMYSCMYKHRSKLHVATQLLTLLLATDVVKPRQYIIQ